MECAADVLHQKLEAMARCTEKNRPYTRLSYTKEDLAVKRLLIDEMKALGMSVYLDKVGNLFGLLEGCDPKAPLLLVGSHSDTVISGGRFDGIAGVVVGLEVARCLREEKQRPRGGLVLVAMAEEEGGRFGRAFIGSRWMVGDLNDEDLSELRDQEGCSIESAALCLKEFDDQVNRVHRFEPLPKWMIEVHCEQGPVLEEKEVSLGMVQGITGSSAYHLTLSGDSNHAGTTPMAHRQDPMVAACEIAIEMDKFAHASKGKVVATTGQLTAKPGAYNIIPGVVSMTLDLRSTDAKILDETIAYARGLSEQVAKRRKVKLEMDTLHEKAPVQLSQQLVDSLTESSKKRGYSYHPLYSGAGHDAIVLSEVCETAMVFVPSHRGKSHCPEEKSSPEDLSKAAQIIVDWWSAQ